MFLKWLECCIPCVQDYHCQHFLDHIDRIFINMARISGNFSILGYLDDHHPHHYYDTVITTATTMFVITITIVTMTKVYLGGH